MRRLSLKLLLALGSAAVFFGTAEALYRWLGPNEGDPAGMIGAQYYRDQDWIEIGPEDALARGMLEKVEPAPRFRLNFVPNTRVRICYRNYAQEYFDEHGCVPYFFNACAIRDRDEVCEPKPDGQRRVVCVGDSMTVGWGVRREDCWTTLVERALRERDDAIRTVNCGASGALLVDEYRSGLEHRFLKFDPDVVLVALCLNDLLPVNGPMSQTRELPWWAGSRILRDLARRRLLLDELRLDPDRDWVQALLDLPEERYPQWAKDLGRDALWAGGGAQRAMTGMRDWCRERDIAFGVCIWPFVQGLGDGETYPFAKMHRLVEAFCDDRGIPFLDLAPELRGHSPAQLWVTPSDLHCNDDAHRLASPAIARFVAGLLGL